MLARHPIHERRHLLPLLAAAVAAHLAPAVASTFSGRFLVVVVGFLSALLALPAAWRTRRLRTRVRAGAAGLTVGERFIPSAAIRSAVVAHADPVSVTLSHEGGGRLHLEVGSAGEARSLVGALELDGSREVVESRTRPGPLSGALAAAVPAAAWLALGRGDGRAAVACLFAVGLLVTLARATAPRLGVGTDGLALRRPWRRRVVGYGAVASVHRYEEPPRWGRGRRVGLAIALRSGDTLLVPLDPDAADPSGAEVEGRIREAMRAFHEGDPIPSTTLLQRGSRNFHAWMTALRALGAGANAGPRTAPVPRDRLLRIVEDAAASPTDHVAAAVALGGQGDAESSRRLGAAVRATVAPRLRVALEKAAGGADEAELEAALEAIEAEARPAWRAWMV